MHRDEVFALLGELSAIRCPSGREQEIDAFLDARLARFDLRNDGAGNRIVRIAGRGVAPATAIAAHKDEIGAIVKRVEPDGRLRLVSVGDSHPWIWGEGPLELLGDDAAAIGVLSFGARHVSKESPQLVQTRDAKGVEWGDAWVETKLTEDALRAMGIRAGTRATLPPARRVPVRLGTDRAYVACPALDDKIAVAVLLSIADELRSPAGDVELVFTSREEVSCGGARYYARSSEVDRFIAVEIAPVAAEYGLECVADPVLIEADARSTLDHGLAGELAACARLEGFDPRHVVLDRYASDASTVYADGYVGRAACVAVATENTHGCEIAHLDAVDAVARTLVRWLA